MSPNITLESFLAESRLSQEIWEKAAVNWNDLKAIGCDHISQTEKLQDAAEMFSRVIQRIPKVHSVRLRIKNPINLMAKIVRKRAENNEKYKNISVENYFDSVTDLIGLRALHLFKDDCFGIDPHIRDSWQHIEKPSAYIRQGDPQELSNRYISAGFELKVHPAGYRSIHYVCTTQPHKRKVAAEIQIRTIFEEGWSEIDHTIRYPNFSDNQHISYFLTIFNRLAGSADEMGTFVQDLSKYIHSFNAGVLQANQQKEDALTSMEQVLGELNTMKKEDAASKAKISQLQSEISKLRSATSLPVMLPLASPSARGQSGTLDRKDQPGIIDILAEVAQMVAKNNLISSSNNLKTNLDKEKK